jgi:hypothetical protein
MISFWLPVYAQAHGGLICVFNNLASSYAQAHGFYAQSHAGATFPESASHYNYSTYADRRFPASPYMVMVLWFSWCWLKTYGKPWRDGASCVLANKTPGKACA